MTQISKRKDKSEYEISRIGEVQANILIGGKDIIVGNKFVSNFNISWECFSGKEKYFLNLNRKNVVITNEKELLSKGALSLKVGNTTDVWKINEDKTDWDIVYRTDPRPTKSGDWIEEFEIKCSKELEFFYQSKALAIPGSNVPDNVDGSYAIYCDKRDHIIGIANYMTGKLGHLYRPLIKDSKGKTEWAIIEIKDNILIVTIPKSFLDTAKFPVILDPTCGYTSVGGNNYTQSSDNYYAAGTYLVQASANGTGSKIKHHTVTASKKVKLAVADGHDQADRLSLEYENVNTLAGDWTEVDISGESLSIVQNSSYYPHFVVEANGAGMYYDNGNNGDSYSRNDVGTGYEITDPTIVNGTSRVFRFSTYMEYTTGAAAGLAIPIAMHYQKQLRN